MPKVLTTASKLTCGPESAARGDGVGRGRETCCE